MGNGSSGGSVRYFRHGEGFWREMIARQKDSGLGIRKFCMANGLSNGTFHKWQARFAEQANRKGAESIVTPDALFIPVTGKDTLTIATQSAEPGAGRPSSRDAVTLTCGGVRVELTGAHADRIVRHLLGRLGGFAC
jgi:hypothetical protein